MPTRINDLAAKVAQLRADVAEMAKICNALLGKVDDVPGAPRHQIWEDRAKMRAIAERHAVANRGGETVNNG